MNEVTLTPYEMSMCAHVGMARYQNALELRRDPGLGPSCRSGPANSIRGARCEFAVSLLLNLYWRPTVGEIHERDVGGLVDVRSSKLRDGRLIVKPADSDLVPFVLAIQLDDESPRFAIPGWLYARRVKGQYPLVTTFGDPAHFAPQSDLHPIEALLEWLRAAACKVQR